MGRHDAPATDEGEPVTAPIALPRAVLPESRVDVVARAQDVGAGAVSATVRGAGLMGSVVSAAGRGVVGQVRAEVGSRWPSRAPGAVVPAPVRSGMPWLVVPALLGWVPVALVLFAVPWVPRALHLVWEAAPDEIVGVGQAPMALGVADAILTVVAIMAIVMRVRTRVAQRGRRS